MMQARIMYGARIEFVNNTTVDLKDGEVYNVVASYINESGKVMVVLHKPFYAPFAINKDDVLLLNLKEEKYTHAIN